ncbi:hypothetical protein SVA_0024 [Sulfurifustis variabilis]|uniref:Protein Smg homolog n=1 Tax=Sulfurifustis variabilis TaxID=1675686 RepID=A0A1B4VCN1_9GAMM|nr:DUF494 domain-containing protein [Sulfurifustis variabilis]BAU46607.1 hypothetical protein SVA_0024 [Sulfurifustis variabilis]
MKENVFDVLMYLFENYMDGGPELSTDQKQLTVELAEAGFRKGEIRKAFRWLEGLAASRSRQETDPVRAHPAALRHYTGAEARKLNAECRGFLLFIEASGVLDAHARELVIERVMALDLEEISVEQLKWVLLMVLGNQTGQEHAQALLEDLVFDGVQGYLH